MTKAEIQAGLEAKFDIVTIEPKADVLGVKQYVVNTMDIEGRPATHTVYVSDEGGANEKAWFPGSDPLAVVPTPQPSFTERVRAEIEARKTAGTIVDAYIKMDTVTSSMCEVVAYSVSANDVARNTYVIHDNNGTLQFKKVV